MGVCFKKSSEEEIIKLIKELEKEKSKPIEIEVHMIEEGRKQLKQYGDFSERKFTVKPVENLASKIDDALRYAERNLNPAALKEILSIIKEDTPKIFGEYNSRDELVRAMEQKGVKGNYLVGDEGIHIYHDVFGYAKVLEIDFELLK